MTIRTINNATISDVKRELGIFLYKGITSEEVRSLAEQITRDKSDDIEAVYDWVKSNMKYVPDPSYAELFISPVRMAKNYFEGKPMSGDCIGGTSPVWIKRNGLPELVEVRELLPVGSYAQFVGTDVLTPTGFQPLTSIRKKITKKPIIRLLDSSDIELTNDHKVLTNSNTHDNGRYTKVEDVKNGQLIKVYPSLLSSYPGEYEIGWAYGLFFADGSCSLEPNHREWGIDNINSEYLERAKSAFQREFPNLIFSIHSYLSNTKPTNYGIRSKPLKTLTFTLKRNYPYNSGIRTRFVRRQGELFYNRFKVKRVPSFILHGSLELAKGFWDGAMAGDGDKNTKCISSGAKLSSFGLACINTKLGFKSRIYPDGIHAWVYCRTSNKNDGTIKKIDSRVGGEVYDIATSSGEFIAGDVAVKNCDDHSLFDAALLGSIGYKVHIVLGDTNLDNEIDHAWAEVYSDKLGQWISVDTTNKNPLGWNISAGGKIAIEAISD